MNPRIAVRAIILDSTGKLFCVRLKAYGGKAERDFWCTPGGGRDPGESLPAALERELVEETGVKPTIGNLLYVQQFKFEGQEQLEFFFHVTNYQDYGGIDTSTASHAEAEIAEHGFVDPEKTHLLPAFLSAEDITLHATSPNPAKLFSYL